MEDKSWNERFEEIFGPRENYAQTFGYDAAKKYIADPKTITIKDLEAAQKKYYELFKRD